MHRSRVAAVLATVIATGALATGATAAQATPPSNSFITICYGGETNSVDRRIDTMLVKLNVAQGAVRGYWVQYGDEIKAVPGARKIDAMPVFIALPPDPEKYPGPYILDFKESYSIGTNITTVAPNAAAPDTLTYRDTPDWQIREGGAVTVEGRIFGNLGNFSSCGFGWQF